ncbi:MAG: adenosylcobalamin-dependent ribonucleoside-diphosphate reductase, partial [Thermomicrobiales bacterium]
LSGGGTSSGLMSFLKVGDRAAGAIKSGGTTRRAAKMVVLDLDHPDIEGFVSWKANEEKKVAALIAAGYPSDYNGDAYATVSGQNSNNSVRVPDSFIAAVEADATWDLIRRTDGTVHRTVRARDLWDRIADAAWQCADPGVQFDTTINAWHTCPAAGRINASNPCSEYLFLDNTACNLASLNLLMFMDTETNAFDVDGFRHAARLWTIVLEISVLMAQFPSEDIARRSYDYRTLGLGYANIGSVLMRLGLPYDSDAARAYTGAVTALMTGESYAASAEMAAHLGPFPGFAANRDDMLRVIRNHRRAAHDAAPAEYEDLAILPMGIREAEAPAEILAAARRAWDVALDGGERHGYRNAQTTLLAPTGTIGLLMDCDTTGVEPDFALVKFKKLAGGGYFKIANQSLDPALRNLGYDAGQRKAILTYVLGTLSLEGAPHINRHSLAERGFSAGDLDAVERTLPGTFELGFAFNAWSLGEAALARVGIDMATASAPGFDLLAALGFSRKQIAEANEHICGTMTIEGAPHLRDEHLPVFDCANRCGAKGQRYISAMGHIGMMASAQSFLSGAISKTLNMPHEATAADIEDAYLQSWKHGIKALALYRDGSKLSQPLSTKSDVVQDDAEDVIAAEAAIQARIDEAVAVAVAKAMAAAETAKAAEAPAIAAAMTPIAEPVAPMPEIIPATRPVVAPALVTSQAASEAHRRRLPSKRNGFTQEARVAGQKVYLRTGEYADGTLGEIFIDMHKEGAAFRSMINCFAIAVSKGLQYGVPLDEFIDTFTFTRFEPQGMVSGHPNIKTATSIIDFVFRVLGLEYEGRTDLVHVQPEPVDTAAGAPADAPADAGSPVMAQSGPIAGTAVGSIPGTPGPGDAHGSAQAGPVTGETSGAGGANQVGGSGGGPAATAVAAPATTPSPATAAMTPAPNGNGAVHGNGSANGNGNGNGHGHHEPLGTMSRLVGTATTASAVAGTPMAGMVNQMDAHLANMMGDAPFCDVCGHITVRNG